MIKVNSLILGILCFFSLTSSAQFSKIKGKYNYVDSAQFSKYKNNPAGDSVLTTDTAGKLKMKIVSGGAGSSWLLIGNSGTDTSVNFIGTTDGKDFISKAYSREFTRLIPYAGTDTGYFGYVINSNYATDPGNFSGDVTAAGGASSTAVAGGRQLSVAATNFTQLFYIPNKWTASVLPTSFYRAVGIKTAANNGLILSQEVVSTGLPYWARLWAEYDFNTGVATVKMTNGSGTATLETSSALPAISTGDSIECYFAYDYGNLTVRIKNLNTGSTQTVTHTSWTAPNYAPTVYYPCVFFPLTTNVTVLQSLQVYIEAYKSPDFNFVGHSVLQGYGIARAELIPELIRSAMPNYKIQVDAMGSMRTQDGLLWIDEIQRINGKYTCIMFGANDGGISDASFYASYRALRDSIVQQGSKVVHFGQLPSSYDFTSRNDSLKILYESLGDIWIDIFPLLKNGSGYTYNPAYDYGDGIHPNLAGNQVIVNEFLRVMKSIIRIPVNSDYVDVSKNLTLKKNATYTDQQIFNSDRDLVDKGYVDSLVSGGGGGGLAIGQMITGATDGSVLFVGSAGTLQQANSDFYYDITNKRLGVGVINPSYTIHAKDSLSGNVSLIAENKSASATSTAVIGVVNDVGNYGAFEMFSSGNPLFPNAASFSTNGDFIISTITAINPIKLRTNFIDRLTIDGGGNVGIGVISPATPDSMLTVDGGLWVNRGARFSGLIKAPGVYQVRTDGTGNFTYTDTSTLTATSTTNLTNKRWTPRVGSATSSATPTINTDNYDVYKLTAQTADITSFTTNLTGTPSDGEVLEIQITGTAARAITWGSSFVSSTVTLPATTVTTATLTVIFQYFTTSSYGNNKWICVNSF